jgi:hypothetical protein
MNQPRDLWEGMIVMPRVLHTVAGLHIQDAFIPWVHFSNLLLKCYDKEGCDMSWNYKFRIHNHIMYISLNLKNFIFLDNTLCRMMKVNWRFGGTYRLHFQGCRVDHSQKMAAICSSKSLLTFAGLHRVISQERTVHTHLWDPTIPSADLFH